jgi:hypothetical protein
VSMYCAAVLSPASDRTAQRDSVGPPVARRDPDVKVLLISQRADGFYLERFNERGESLGTTRHDEMDDAMREAYSQYDPISEWRLCPEHAGPLEYLRGAI